MIRKLITAVLSITLTVGTILIALHLTGINGLTVVEQHTINYFAQYKWTYYTFNLNNYLKNLETSIKIEQLKDALPNAPVFPTKPNGADILGWVKFIGSIITVYLINWLIFIINMTAIMPLKLALYPINILMAILGINTSDIACVQMFRIVYGLNIPLIKNY